jgi:histidinol dehydrogenase
MPSLTRLDRRGLAADEVARDLPRPAITEGGPVAVVADVLRAVREEGDAAVRRFTAQFDGCELDDLRVPAEAMAGALDKVPRELRSALEAASDAIAAYHRTQVHAPVEHVHSGVRVRSVAVPVDRAGCYVPGGATPLASTALMTAVPAKVAGVGEVAVATPPGKDGKVADAVLAACSIAGVDVVYRIGGAQAIAALAYGTETIRAVDVVAGPGSVYVAIAKRLVAESGLVGIPSAFAGPSEVVVIADASVPPELAAIDVVVQAEHGPDSLAWLVTWDDDVLAQVSAAVDAIVAGSPRRAPIEATLEAGGFAVLVDGPNEALAVANAIAPEHLELMVDDADVLVAGVRHAGAVFCGPWTPASIGDYMAGPSHVLPTFGSARFGQALTVADFTKHVHVVTADRDALARVAPHIAALARAEGLDAHERSVSLRLGA